MWSIRLSFTWAVSFIASVHAVKLFSNSTVPTNLTSACATALSSDVNCSPFVVSLRTGMYYSNDTLERTCTANCDSALTSYRARIVTACAMETWLGYEDAILPVVTIPELLQYQYNLSCLMDSGRYCNNVAASYAAGRDPSEKNAIDGGAGQANGAGNATDPCDLCFIKNLRFQAGSPYYDGPALARSSIYEQKTSSCGISGYPLITTALPFPTPIQPSTAPSTACAGKIYDIQLGDDCHSVSKSQSISNTWLLTDNNLAANCADFPKNGPLCLINTCDVYTTGQNDTCASISKAHNITEAQFKSWNPEINAGCYNLARMNGSEMCVSVPGKPYIYPSPTQLAPRIPVTAAPVPTDAAEGTNINCGRWYRAELGDYCNMIVIKFGSSLQDFIFLNPVINENCTNLNAEESYCVLAVGDINTYSGRPGYQASTISSFVPSTKFSDLPDATYTSTTKTSTALPLATDTRGDCFMYFDGDEYQEGLSGTNWNSPCELAAAVFNVRLEDLQNWNPALRNTSLSSCTFTSGARYCGKWYNGDPPPNQMPSDSSLPVRPNTTENCTEYLDVTDGWDCASILDIYHLTIAQFSQYNPSVGTDCSQLWLGYQYCVRTPNYVDETGPSGTITSATLTTSTIGPIAPTQTGQPSNCNKWHIAQSGDSCASIENTYFITSEQFLSWNKAVSIDCSAGFWVDYAYCVGTTDTISATRSSQPPLPTSTTPSIPIPTPNQPNNAISNCNKFVATQNGDWCALFADRNGITVEQLYGWNSVLGPDGSGCSNQFWSGYYYCVGVSA